MRRTIFFVMLAALAGCAAVRPWERGRLAAPTIQFAIDPVRRRSVCRENPGSLRYLRFTRRPRDRVPPTPWIDAAPTQAAKAERCLPPPRSVPCTICTTADPACKRGSARYDRPAAYVARQISAKSTRVSLPIYR